MAAYNTTRGRERFHAKGRGNGYILTFGDKRVYVAGDTENIPEMKALKDIAVAFLPMNLPYTMTPAMVADAALAAFAELQITPERQKEEHTGLRVLQLCDPRHGLNVDRVHGPH